ncbi:hypothetical protein EGW08_004058, partial [Elysia chlorotica]
QVEEPTPDPEMTLLTYLRTRLLLTGSKLGCGEGGCGACTVMVSRYSPHTDQSMALTLRATHYSVNACLAPICSVHGLAVTTVEGIGSLSNIHPVQERIAKFHGSQCGFCTPGIVMSMYTLLRNNPSPTTKELQENFDGNLCRCTGYRSILDGFRTFTKEFTCGMGSQCCQNKSNGDILGPQLSTLRPFDPTQEPIFPPELKVKHQKYHEVSLRFAGPRVTWVRPTSLDELLELKKSHPKARFVVGNTEVGIETKFKNQMYSVLVSSSHIAELTTVEDTDLGLRVGGSVTLSQLDWELKQRIKSLPEFKTRIFCEFVEMLKWFASNQIRNVASVSGNIMTASPISDLNPLFVAAGATVEAMSKDRGMRTVAMDKDFFCGYRRTALAPDEVLVSVTIPCTKTNEFFQGFKQCNRKEDDISMVNAGMMVRLSDSHVVNDIVLAYGGMGPTVVLAQQAMEGVIGLKWDESLMSKMCDLLPADLTLTPGSPGGAEEYRRALALSFFFKFFLRIKQTCDLETTQSDLSALEPMDSSELKSIQVIGARDSRSKVKDCVGQAVPHKAALQQSTGQAIYVDDMTPIRGELHMALVTSTRSYAKILSIDPSAALHLPGVLDFVSARDVPGINSIGYKMDSVFAVDEVTCQGQIIGAVVADTIDLAHRAARLVNVQYEDKTPLVITIEDAIQHSSFYPDVRTISVGDLEQGFSGSAHTLSGECRMNAQNHFYLETMATRALPGEAGEMEVFCSTQHAAAVQEDIAKVLGISSHKIAVRTKRMGGGFGGKETQSSLSAVPTAVAAHKLHKPVRCVLDRDEDMVTTGNRHPFLAKYKVTDKSLSDLTEKSFIDNKKRFVYLPFSKTIRACETLIKRLEPVVKTNPKASWEETVRIKLLILQNVFDYCLNPAIDVGQIEGAFTQGYGLLLLEDVKVTPDGTHLTRGPGNYKIPAFGNIASQMNVYLVPDSPNPRGPFFSRGVGEPPLLLALSAFYAARDAIKTAREETGASRIFQLDSPALPQHIRMACEDHISKRFPEIDPASYRPWTVKL